MVSSLQGLRTAAPLTLCSAHQTEDNGDARNNNCFKIVNILAGWRNEHWQKVCSSIVLIAGGTGRRWSTGQQNMENILIDLNPPVINILGHGKIGPIP